MSESISIEESIGECMPAIDNIMEEQNLPIYSRHMYAAILYVKATIVCESEEDQKKLLKSKFFYEKIIPEITQWYFLKYGQLAKDPKNINLKGLIFIYHQPFLIEFPATTSKVEVENESSWLKFSDHLEDSESMTQMIHGSLEIDKLCTNDQEKVSSQLMKVVSLTRKINLNLMSASNLDFDHSNMASGIIPHFDKAISDILTHQDAKASVASWELHLAIEKSLKIYIKDKSGNKKHGHKFEDLTKLIRKSDPQIDLTLINDIPDDQDAIKLRYAEKISSISDVFQHYINALELVNSVTSLLSRKYKFNNSSFLINKAPWVTA